MEIVENILKGLLDILSLIPNLIFLTMDGIVYSVLIYAYKLFELMTRMNFSSLRLWFDPIIDNITALIIVVVMFTIGYALINYLINPDKISDNKIGGSALIKNIAIAAVLLLIYSEFFKIMNEVTFLLIGAPESYSYTTVLKEFGIENDGGPGLISNIIYGNSASSEEEDVDFGVKLSVNTLNIFLHSKSSGTIIDKAYNDTMEGKEFSLMQIVGAFTEIESAFYSDGGLIKGRVVYRFPILSTLVGLFLIYTLVTISIELGVRALKLVILELLAPIAIATIVKDGWGAKIWKNWLSVYWKTYADIFIRVASMYIVIGIMSRAWNNIADLFSDAVTSGQFTKYLLLIIIIIAGFQLAKELPKFIDSILGSKLAENNKNGFGSFLGGLAGGLAGTATGVASGVANKAGVLGTAFNAAKGGITGAQNGSKGKGIADTMKKISENNKANTTRAQAIGRQGGGLRYLGANVENALGVPQRHAGARQRILDENKAIDNLLNAQANEIKGDKYAPYGIEYGADRDAFAQQYAQKATVSAANDVAATKDRYSKAYSAQTSADSSVKAATAARNSARGTLSAASAAKASASAAFTTAESSFAAVVGNDFANEYIEAKRDGRDVSSYRQGADSDYIAAMDAIDTAMADVTTADNNFNVAQTAFDAAEANLASANTALANADAEVLAAKQANETAQNDYNKAYSDAVSNGKKAWSARADQANGAAVQAAKKEARIKNSDLANMSNVQLRTRKKTNKQEADAIANKGATRRADRQGSFNSK